MQLAVLQKALLEAGLPCAELEYLLPWSSIKWCMPQGIDGSAIPAATKAKLREALAVLQKALLEQQKAAGAANKGRATAVAVEAADAAAAAGRKFAVVQLEVRCLLLSALSSSVSIVKNN